LIIVDHHLTQERYFNKSPKFDILGMPLSLERAFSGAHSHGKAYNDLGNHGKASTSSDPTLAPANYRTLAPSVKLCEEWDETVSHGSGVECNLRCEGCGAGGADAPPAQKAMQIYAFWTMQRNGNERTRTEIRCARCDTYSVIERWEEG
jgi:hypothetical protein